MKHVLTVAEYDSSYDDVKNREGQINVWWSDSSEKGKKQKRWC